MIDSSTIWLFGSKDKNDDDEDDDLFSSCVGAKEDDGEDKIDDDDATTLIPLMADPDALSDRSMYLMVITNLFGSFYCTK